MKVQWTQSLATGVGFIDAQHKELFQRTDALVQACLRGEGTDAVVGTLAFLTQYVVEHFNAEEELMRTARYAGLAEHAKQHREFRRTVDVMTKELMTRGHIGTDFVVKINRLIVGWLTDHISRVDVAMAAAIRDSVPAALLTRA